MDCTKTPSTNQLHFRVICIVCQLFCQIDDFFHEFFISLLAFIWNKKIKLPSNRQGKKCTFPDIAALNFTQCLLSWGVVNRSKRDLHISCLKNFVYSESIHKRNGHLLFKRGNFTAIWSKGKRGKSTEMKNSFVFKIYNQVFINDYAPPFNPRNVTSIKCCKYILIGERNVCVVWII